MDFPLLLKLTLDGPLVCLKLDFDAFIDFYGSSLVFDRLKNLA